MRTTAENSKFLSVLNNPKSKIANRKLAAGKTRAGIFALAAACLFTAWSGHAAEMFVPKAARPPVLDGRISDGEWASGVKSGKFMILGDPTNAATEQTEAFLMRDDKNLYAAFHCHESQVDRIKAAVKERNGQVWVDDDVEFFICAGENPVNYRQFVVNSLGTQLDDCIGKEGDWQAKAFVGTNFWTVEMAIPFAYLGSRGEEGLMFRGHFCRGQKSKSENSAWPAIGGGLFADMANSALIVFGSFKDAAMRELEGLAGKTEALGESAAGEKAGILKEIKELAEEVKAGKKLSFREWRGVQKRTSELENKKTALEAKMLAERFAGAGSSNKVYLTSDVSRGGYDLPEVWGTRKILGKDFWFDIRHLPDIWEKMGLENDPFLKESLMRLTVGSNNKQMVFNLGSPAYQAFKETSRPFIVNGIDFNGPSDMDPSVCRRFLAEYGHRFAGFMADECFGNKSTVFLEKMGLPLPQTRLEAYLGFVAAYLAHDNRFRSWALTIPEFRPWTSPGTATYLDHLILEMGAPLTGQEIGGAYSRQMGMCFAFSRGAARQYKKPWRVYVAVWCPGVQGDSEMNYRDFLSPECRRFTDRSSKGKWSYDQGPYSGTSLSLQRRQLYAAYMSGVNMIKDESDPQLFMANYDYRDIDGIDSLVKVMRDKAYHLSPAGAIRKELYDNIVKKHARGTAYTPAALVFDRHHGFIPTYSRTHLFGVLPYTAGDCMMLALESALYPLLSPENLQARATGPYGDMFDVLTNNSRSETLQAYRALILAGDVDLDERNQADNSRKSCMFAKRLMDYVENGGTLLINVKQIPEGVFSDAFLGCKITSERGEGRFGYSLLDGAVIAENKTFGYQRLEPKTAVPLILRADADGKRDALVTANRYGKGVVILTAPD